MKSRLLLSLTLVGATYCVSASNSGGRPNVIIVVADDQGYGDLACLGNEIIKTPNLDKFYSQSVRLTDFHVSPTSAPSRSSIMTGRYADRVGVWHTIGGRSILFDDEVTMPEVMSEAGYTTGIFGKWHLGDSYPYRPEDRGFDEVVVHGGGGVGQAPDYWGNDYFSDTYRHNGKYEKYDGYCTDVFFSEAINFIRANKDNPFFCYLAPNAPHGPVNVPAEYHKLYMGDERLTPEQQRFYGMITNIDDNFETLRRELKRLKIEDNTILIYMTDNGTAYGYCSVDGREYGYSGGMRGQKATPWEGGHRVPMFVRYPDGGIKGGRDIDELTAHIDMLPTIANLCGVSLDNHPKKLDGVSLANILRGEESKLNPRTVITDSQRRQNLVKWNGTAVMRDKWRLIDGVELYNVESDPMQQDDVAAQYPEVVRSLTCDYDSWWDELVEQGVNLRYAYTNIGGEENPVCISSHDMAAEDASAHNHNGVLLAKNPLGNYKIEVLKKGRYKVEMCRYPKESNLKFNSQVEAIPASIELENGSPASVVVDFDFCEINFSKYTIRKSVDMDSSSVDFILDLEPGHYDMDSFFATKSGVKYPIYYIYFTLLE